MSDYKAFIKLLNEQIPGLSLKEGEPMSAHTSFRIGGPADIFIDPAPEEIAQVISLCRKEEIAVTVIGNGSNILVGDGGIRGVVMAIGKNNAKVEISGEEILADSGALLSGVSRKAADASLAGMEFASGIPGSIGGGVYMNAGAYGGSMEDIVTSVTAIDCDGNIHNYSGDELELSYRHSIFHSKDEIITQVKLKLTLGDRDKITAYMDELSKKRREKQPVEFPSAGSTFKRPEGYFAGKLIEDAGLKGYRVGGACVSNKHAGFVINDKGATALEVRELMEGVIKRVEECSGVRLEPEVRFVGEF